MSDSVVSGAVIITLGYGNEVGLIPQDHPDVPDFLVFRDTKSGESVDLGPATEKRISQIQEYLERLKIHAVPERDPDAWVRAV